MTNKNISIVSFDEHSGHLTLEQRTYSAERAATIYKAFNEDHVIHDDLSNYYILSGELPHRILIDARQQIGKENPVYEISNQHGDLGNFVYLYEGSNKDEPHIGVPAEDVTRLLDYVKDYAVDSRGKPLHAGSYKKSLGPAACEVFQLSSQDHMALEYVGWDSLNLEGKAPKGVKPDQFYPLSAPHYSTEFSAGPFSEFGQVNQHALKKAFVVPTDQLVRAFPSLTTAVTAAFKERQSEPKGPIRPDASANLQTLDA